MHTGQPDAFISGDHGTGNGMHAINDSQYPKR
jgi:hypothetical protein